MFLKGLEWVENCVGYNHIKQQTACACWIEIHWIFNLPFLESIIAFKELFKLFRLGPKTVLSFNPKDWQLPFSMNCFILLAWYFPCWVGGWVGGLGQVNIKDHLSQAKLELGLSLAMNFKNSLYQNWVYNNNNGNENITAIANHRAAIAAEYGIRLMLQPFMYHL